MTTVNLAVQPRKRAAYLITDGARCTPDGRLEHVGGKSIAFERFPCAIGLSGNLDPMALGRECLAADTRNLGSLVKALPGILHRACAATLSKYPNTPSVFAVLRVAAWSARQRRPIGYMITTDDYFASACIGEGWHSYEVAEVTSSLGSDVRADELLGRPCELEDPALFDPDRDGFALVAAQRQRPQASLTPGSAPDAVFWIGGEVELVEVTRKGVKVWCLGKFPDAIGERIDPRIAA